MSADRTPLVQKLILLVLILNLGCLVVLVVRGWPNLSNQRPQATLPPAIVKGESTVEPFEPLEPRVIPTSSKTPAVAIASRASTQRSDSASEEGQIAPPTSFSPPAPTPRTRTLLVAPPPRASGVVQSAGVENSGGEIVGTVTLLGTPPPEKQIQMDAMCARLRLEPAFTRHYVTNSDRGLANVFVYLSHGVTGHYAVPSEPVLIDQIDCMFEPYIVGARVGQKIRIQNSDPLLHNVHATPRPGSGNKEFNFGQPTKGQANQIGFLNPELFIRLKCDVHPWMFAYVCVAEHPFFALTDRDGEFRLPSNIPPGRYTLTARHLKAGSVSHEIRLRAGERQIVGFQLSVPAPGYAER